MGNLGLDAAKEKPFLLIDLTYDLMAKNID